MAMRSWVWVGALAWLTAACGGKAETGHGAPGSAGRATSSQDDDAPVTTAPSGAGGSISIAIGGASSVSAGIAGSVSDEAAGTGGDGGADGVSDFAYVSKVLVECPAELCAGTVAASACAALPSGVVRTAAASCDGNGGATDRMGTLTFELSATRRKACYYEQATFEAPSLLVGAEAWDDRSDLFDGTKSHVGAGTYPNPTCPYPSGPSTLCDLQNPANDPPLTPNVPARACFNGFSGTCEPCCDDANGKHPDCTGKPQNYPGFDCTPHIDHGEISYCSCSCDGEQWSCAC